MVELYIDGKLHASTMAEETRLSSVIGLYRYMATIDSDGSLFEIFIIKKSIKHWKKLDKKTQKLFDEIMDSKDALFFSDK